MAHADRGEARKTPPPDGKANQRRSRRVVETIRVKISSLSPDGQLMEHEAETLVIGRYGARIHTDLPLQLGASIKLTVLNTGAMADAVVTWISPESDYEFGIELTNASDIWGISLPPSAAGTPTPS